MKPSILRVFALAVFLSGFGVTASPATEPSDICPVHGIKMDHATLRIVYGMPSGPEFAEMKVAKEKFPHGRDYVLAGCVVKPAKTVDGFLCPRCVEARKAWLENNKPKKAGE